MSRRTAPIFLALTMAVAMSLGLFSAQASAETKNSPVEPSTALRPASGPLVGSITVSRGSFVYIRSNIFLGVDTKTLKRGVGYWPGTGRPGSLGNPTFAGHRTAATKPFNLLVNVRNGDRVQIYYGGVKYEYQVFDHFNVKPTDVWIKNGKSFSVFGTRLPTLTLFTCNNGTQSRYAVFAFKINNGPTKPKVPLPPPPSGGGKPKPPAPSW